MNRRWICTDVLMDIFPFFDHAQLGLKLALISPRFEVLVDKHFAGKSELTTLKELRIEKVAGGKAKLFVLTNSVKTVQFPLPDRPLPNKIRFKLLVISYIDHSVIAFLRANQQIWDRSGINLSLNAYPYQSDLTPNSAVFVREIWPIFAPNIRRLGFPTGVHLDNLLRHTSQTILAELDQLNSIFSGYLLPAAICDFGGPNAISDAGQALAKWLHTPTKDGQPKRLRCKVYPATHGIDNWINSLKEAFLCATTCASHSLILPTSVPIVPFELVNERTRETLTLEEGRDYHYPGCPYWLLKRCPIGETTAVQWEDGNSKNLNKVIINLSGDEKRIHWAIVPIRGGPKRRRKRASNCAEVNYSVLM